MRRACLLLFLLLWVFLCYAQFPADLQKTKSILNIESKDSVNNRPRMRFIAGGRIKLQGIYDFQGLQNTENFHVFEIPIPETDKSDRFLLGIETSRFKLDAELNDPKVGTIKAYIEGDFAGTGNTFRLRHAYVKWRNWLFGQYWSVFADEDAFPFIVDNDGPSTAIFARNPQMRFMTSVRRNLNLELGLEYTTQLVAFSSELDTLAKSTYQTLPDITARLKLVRPWWHLQVAGVMRDLRYKSGETANGALGYGAMLSAFIYLDNRKDNIIIQGITGRGIAKYLVGFNTFNLDAFPTGSGSIRPIPVNGGFIAFQKYFDRKNIFSSTLLYGYANAEDNISNATNKYIVQGHYFSGNFGWNVVPQLHLVLEGLYGIKYSTTHERGDAARIQFMTQYDF